MRFTQTAGGRTGAPAPRHVHGKPFFQIASAIAWTTLALTIRRTAPPSTSSPARARFRGTGSTTGRKARGEVGHDRLQGVVPKGVRQEHALGRRGLARLRHRRSRARSSASCRLDHARRGALEAAQARGRRRAGRAGRRRARAVSPPRRRARGEVDGETVAEIGPGAILGERAVVEGGSGRRRCVRSRPARSSRFRRTRSTPPRSRSSPLGESGRARRADRQRSPAPWPAITRRQSPRSPLSRPTGLACVRSRPLAWCSRPRNRATSPAKPLDPLRRISFEGPWRPDERTRELVGQMYDEFAAPKSRFGWTRSCSRSRPSSRLR